MNELEAYSGNHFSAYISYHAVPLKLSATCQLDLNKSEKKKVEFISLCSLALLSDHYFTFILKFSAFL